MKKNAFTTVLMAAAFSLGSVFAASDGNRPKATVFPWTEDFLPILAYKRNSFKDNGLYFYRVSCIMKRDKMIKGRQTAWI